MRLFNFLKKSLKTIARAALMVGLAGAANAWFQSGGSIRNHGHTSNTDGGVIGNLSITGTFNAPNGTVAGSSVTATALSSGTAGNFGTLTIRTSADLAGGAVTVSTTGLSGRVYRPLYRNFTNINNGANPGSYETIDTFTVSSNTLQRLGDCLHIITIGSLGGFPSTAEYRVRVNSVALSTATDSGGVNTSYEARMEHHVCYASATTFNYEGVKITDAANGTTVTNPVVYYGSGSATWANNINITVESFSAATTFNQEVFMVTFEPGAL